MAFDQNDTYAWAYAPPSHLQGEPGIPIPDEPPGPEIAPNRPVRLPSGVVAYRETVDHRERLMDLERQSDAARQAAQFAAMDARMLDQMSRVARSTRDIEIARRSIDVMGLQRDIQSGVPIHQAIARHPMALGASYGSALRAVTPAEKSFTPTPVTFSKESGIPAGVRTGRYGERVQWPPASAMPTEPLSTTAVPITDPSGNILGHRAATGPRTGSIIQRAPAPGSVTQEKRMTVDALKAQLRDVERSISQNAAFGASPATKAKLDEWGRQRDELKRKLAELVPGGYSIIPPPVSSGAVGVRGQGTREDPARPETQEQFNSIPSGAIYLNPKDRRLYRKK